jgi:WhiB family redox-sensing transcriptional regulator
MTLAAISLSVEQDELFASAEYLGADPEIFFIERGSSTAEAKAICERCRVEEQCREYAIEHSERHGVWGGRSQPELRIIRRERRRATSDQARRAS